MSYSFKERVFHKPVDNIMEDGKERTVGAIIDKLKEDMGGKDKHGRNRSANNVPIWRVLVYYLRINREYIHLDKYTSGARWKRVIKDEENG